MVLYQSRHDTTEYGRLAQLVEHLLDVQEVTGSSPVPSTIQFVLKPDSLRERVRVRFLFIRGSAEGLLGTVNRNEQRQGIIVAMVSCLLFYGIKFALCELGRPPVWRHWGQSLRTQEKGKVPAYRGVLSVCGMVYSTQQIGIYI